MTKLEVTDLAQAGFEMTLDEYARQVEAGARTMRCNEFFTAPVRGEALDAINRQVALWLRQQGMVVKP